MLPNTINKRVLFASLLKTVLGQEPLLAEGLKSAQITVLGHVAEGSDTVHVVTRGLLTLQGITITQ